jgi:hypothetical protein
MGETIGLFVSIIPDHYIRFVFSSCERMQAIGPASTFNGFKACQFHGRAQKKVLASTYIGRIQ